MEARPAVDARTVKQSEPSFNLVRQWGKVSSGLPNRAGSSSSAVPYAGSRAVAASVDARLVSAGRRPSDWLDNTVSFTVLDYAWLRVPQSALKKLLYVSPLTPRSSRRQGRRVRMDSQQLLIGWKHSCKVVADKRKSATYSRRLELHLLFGHWDLGTGGHWTALDGTGWHWNEHWHGCSSTGTGMGILLAQALTSGTGTRILARARTWAQLAWATGNGHGHGQ